MIKNEDLEIINMTIEYLHLAAKNYKDDGALDLALDLTKVANKVYRNKKEFSARSNQYNKNNKKYHNLTNQLYYYRKTNNQAKVKELEEKIKELKENRTI